MELFSVSCPTCQARLKVRKLAAIGQIVSCPKCQSMVQVLAPPGWTPPVAEVEGPTTTQQQATDTAAVPAAAATDPAGFDRPFGFEKSGAPAWQLWGIAGVGGVLTLGLVVALFFSGPAKPVENLADANQPPKYAGDGLQPEQPVEPEPKKSPEPEPPAKTEEGPKVELPKVELPKVDPPLTDPPKSDPPKVEVPVDPPKVDPPKVEPPKVDPPKTDPPKTDPPKVDPPKLDPPKADPPKVAPAPRVGLPRAEVEARLTTKVESIQAPRVSFADAIETLAQLSGLRITLDLDALSQSGILADEQIALDMQKTTVADVLDRLLDDRGLAYVIEAGQLRVTTQGKQRDVAREESYDVADLCANADLGRDLAALVARVIEPGGWPEPPRFNGGRLEVKHNDWVQRRTAELLRRLRAARNTVALPAGAADKALASRTSRAIEKLLKPLTVNFVDVPLSKIANTLQSRTDFKLLFDALALAEAGHSPDTTATLQTREPLPLANVLLALLQPLELNFRIIDEGTLQITSKAAALEQLDLEFYRVRDLAPAPDRVAALIGRIQAEVFPGSWDAKPASVPQAPAPKAGRSRGLLRPGIVYDPVSGCILVAHHQAAQMQVEDLLDTLRRPVEQPAPEEGPAAKAADKAAPLKK